MEDSLAETSGECGNSAKSQIRKATSSKDGSDMASTDEKTTASSSEADQSSIPSTSQPPSSGTFYLILIQVLSRGLTFVGNQILLRFLSPELLGLSVQLELFSVFVLYFSRESLRVSFQRVPQAISLDDGDRGLAAKSKSEESQAIVNSSYVAIAVGSPLALVTAYLYQHNASQAVTSSPGFNLALQIYVLATIIELLAEPSFAVLQQKLLYGARARSETLAAISKCVSACAAAFFFYNYGYSPSVLPAAIGQLCYASVISIDYARTAFPIARVNDFSMAIKSIKDAPEYVWARFSKPLAFLAATLYAQSIFKQILTQGDAYILSFSASLSDQGAFALASNYGGLIARLFFQPIEEDSRNAFGRLLTGATADRRSSLDMSTALDRLVSICHLYGIVAIGSCCFLDQALPVMVRLIIGRAWWTPEISQILTTYCYYIPFMGLNGILDAFVTSVATPAQLATQSIWMAVFTAIYAAAAYFFLQVLGMGAQGLVIANIINMILRIGWSIVFINKLTGAYKGQLLGHSQKHQDGIFAWAEALPSAASIASGAGIAYGLRTAMAQSSGVTQTLQMLVVSGSLLGAAILVCELKFITSSASNILPPRAAGMVRTFEIQARQRFSVRTIGRMLVPEKGTSNATSTQSD